MNFNISNMLKAEVYDHPVKQIELIETHISWVVLTGDFAYKIKKSVNFGFLDFSTLEKRRSCCEQEVQLNRRLAAELYLDVVAITGTQNNPVISGSGEAVEYAVKMKQFPQSAQLDHMLEAGELAVEHMDAIACMVAEFHQGIQHANETMDFGNNKAVYQPVKENFKQIVEHLDTEPYADTLNALQQWSESRFVILEPVFEQRKADGFVRECHGDMHLRNLVWLKDGPAAFDCIEFNSQLRWIDVISEVAFLVMDLQDRQQHLLASRFLNSYLEATGDYAGLSLLPFYLCYRALVRAKVCVLRLEQENTSDKERAETLAEFNSYLELATVYTQTTAPKLIIMRGVSASGKSSVSQKLVDALGVIRIRSDVERKRLFNISVNDNSVGDIDAGIYTDQASQQTYEKLAELASQVIAGGYSVIVDAAFLKHEQRQPFKALANQLAVPYKILQVTAPVEVLRQRIIDRQHDVSDANLVVLEHQLSNWQLLDDDEMDSAITLDSNQPLDIDELLSKLR